MTREKFFYVRDKMNLSGTDKEELKYLCEIIDASTEVRRLNYSEGMIMHYYEISGGKKLFLCFYPGDQMNLEDKVNEGQIQCEFQTEQLPVHEMEMIGIASMIEDLKINKTVFWFNREKRDLVFASHAFRKTMGVRLPVSDTFPSKERDLLLARKIDNLKAPLYRYTVMRSVSNYHLAVGMFSHNPKREAWTKVTEFVLEREAIETLFWHMDQKAGLEIRVQYKGEAEAMYSIFPECRFVPCYIFRTCDSGNIADKILWGWQDPDDAEAWFLSGKVNVIGGFWEQAFSESREAHWEEAERIQKMQNETYSSEEEVRTFLMGIFRKSMVQPRGVKKPFRELIIYVIENFYEGISKKEILKLVMQALRDGIFGDVGSNADRTMRESIIGEFIASM